MKYMKRFVSYLYSIYNNQKIHNSGFARIELRTGRNRIDIHLQESGYGGKTGTVYLFVRKKEIIQGISIGNIVFRNNQADFRYEQPEENIGQTSWQIMQMNGIIILIDEQVTFLSQWDEQPVDTMRFEIWNPEQTESDSPQINVDQKSGRSMTENYTADGQSVSDPVSREESGTVSAVQNKDSKAANASASDGNQNVSPEKNGTMTTDDSGNMQNTQISTHTSAAIKNETMSGVSAGTQSDTINDPDNMQKGTSQTDISGNQQKERNTGKGTDSGSDASMREHTGNIHQVANVRHGGNIRGNNHNRNGQAMQQRVPVRQTMNQGRNGQMAQQRLQNGANLNSRQRDWNMQNEHGSIPAQNRTTDMNRQNATETGSMYSHDKNQNGSPVENAYMTENASVENNNENAAGMHLNTDTMVSGNRQKHTGRLQQNVGGDTYPQETEHVKNDRPAQTPEHGQGSQAENASSGRSHPDMAQYRQYYSDYQRMNQNRSRAAMPVQSVQDAVNTMQQGQNGGYYPVQETGAAVRQDQHTGYQTPQNSIQDMNQGQQTQYAENRLVQSVQDAVSTMRQDQRTQTMEDDREQTSRTSNICTAEIQPQPVTHQWEQTWRYMLRIYPVLNQFEDHDHVLCVRIEIKDVRLLPEKYWSVVNNSFLLHGFFNYRYLIFGKIGHSWIIGIPGIYQNQEHVMASIFGFPDFLAQAQKNERGEQPGYWYRVLDI